MKVQFSSFVLCYNYGFYRLYADNHYFNGPLGGRWQISAYDL